MKSKLLFEALLKSLKIPTPLTSIYIDLSDQSLEDIDVLLLIDALKDNPAIPSIDLSHNPKLTEKSLLPLMKSLSTLNALSALKLGGLQLTENTLIALGTALQTCKSLQVLDLSDNSITESGLKSLGQGLFHTKLKALYLQNCRLNAAAQAFTSFLLECPKSLEILVLRENHLNSTVAAWLSPILARFSELRKLDVSNNEELGKEGAESIAQVISYLPRLRILRLNQIALAKGLDFFFSALGKASNLRYFSLASNQLGRGDSLLLQKYLSQYPHFLELDLSDNDLIEGDGSLGFAEKLSELVHLQSLNLSDTGCVINLHSLMPHLKRLSHLTVLKFSHKKIGYNLDLTQLGALLQALPHFPSLRLLDLSFTKLKEEAGFILGQALRNQAGLVSLNLAGNPLGEKGIKALLEGIESHPTLKRLSLANSQLIQFEAKGLLTLKSVDLSHNALSDKSIEALCQLLKESQRLEHLSLSHNPFTEAGVKALLEAGLSLNKSLICLELDTSGLTEESGKVLKEIFIQHPSLQKVDWKGNNITTSLVDALEELNAERQRPYKVIYQAIMQDNIKPELLTTLLAPHLKLEENLDAGSLLHHAAKMGGKDIFQMLLEIYQQHHLPMDERNKEGKTPLDLAKEEGHIEIIKLLEKHIKQQKNTIFSPLITHNTPATKFKGEIKFSNSFIIDYNEIQIEKELGKGAFGIVHQGTYCYNSVAIKQLHLAKPSQEALEEFKQEMQLMANLRFPQIIQLYGVYTEPCYGIVMQYMPNGSLYSVLHSNKSLDWSIRYAIALDMTKGIAFLHKENILHRDLKSLNVLLDEHMKAKLTDFGLAKVKQETVSTTSNNNNQAAGTLLWMAPELFKRKAQCTKASDIYSLGMTLWELASRKRPFEDAVNQAIAKQWIVEGEREEIPSDCPSKVAKLITFCWDAEASKRPTADEAVKQLLAQEQEAELSYKGNLDSGAKI